MRSKHEIEIPGLDAEELAIPAIRRFRAASHVDARGGVMPTYSRALFARIGLNFEIDHENRCWSPRRGTVRGFHYQMPPYGQPKLILITRGRMLDVNVDLRRTSPTFGRHVSTELTPDGWNQIFVPEGFAHCYVTLDDDTEVIFKNGAPYAPQYAHGLAWDDPDLAVDWPIAAREAIVLPRDLDRPRFSELREFFP